MKPCWLGSTFDHERYINSLRQSTSPRSHLLVVQPVPTYGPPVVAEVILNGWICHLQNETSGDSTVHKKYKFLSTVRVSL